MNYTPADWYWIVGGDDEQVYASARKAFVPVDDETYTVWLAAGGLPTHIVSFDELKDVLTAAGVAPYLTVTPRQARLALLGAGLLDQVQAAVDAAGGAVKITWEYALTIRRDDPLILAIGASLGLSDAQIDALFEQASQL